LPIKRPGGNMAKNGQKLANPTKIMGGRRMRAHEEVPPPSNDVPNFILSNFPIKIISPSAYKVHSTIFHNSNTLFLKRDKAFLTLFNLNYNYYSNICRKSRRKLSPFNQIN
jgi:hypothetical protein